MKLDKHFDAVIMLTWSDWKKEPRSNRYHYATRFARILPVFFLQHLYTQRDHLSVESSEIENVDIVNVNCGLTNKDVLEIKQLLATRGIRRPLLWIYDSMNYQLLIEALPSAFRVYHATEDYLTKTDGWNTNMDIVANSVIQLLRQVDFMVACTEGVAQSYVTLGNYGGPFSVIENGCDAEYFLEYAIQYDRFHTVSNIPIAIFQGGINKRLDYVLLFDLIKKMPDWEFRFCGASVESEGWNRLLKLPNVRYYGALPPEKFAQLMCESTVGIIPYIQDQLIRNSLPLKAYEYVACGLPVVTVPIAALERDPNLMTIATTADEFKTSLCKIAHSRYDPTFLKQRREAALEKSYNARFLSMSHDLLEAKVSRTKPRRKLKVAMLYDSMGSMHVSTIREHVESFDKYSYHTVTFVPATPAFWNLPSEKVVNIVDFSYFDVVIIHYSVRLSLKEHLDEGLARALESYNGFKVLFIQDEYEGTENARCWMDRLRFDLVYTCVPKEGLDYVYPSYRFPSTEFLSTLTGYVPEDAEIEAYSKPLADRKLFIAYRGRKLPAIYGKLGYDKYRIGVEMQKIATLYDLPVDIEVDDSKRIYATAWYKFLGSARATLGSESGANVFDFDGSLKNAIQKLETRSPDITFEEISEKILAPHEGRVQMNQISPKIFEAIRLRTALVLFEGSYSNAVLPNKHYIPLKKDFSNIDEVICKLKDDAFLQELTDRAYADIVASGKFSYKCFIEAFYEDIEYRVLHSNGLIRLLSPLLFMSADGSPKQALPVMPAGISDTHHLGKMIFADISGVSYCGVTKQQLAFNAKLADISITKNARQILTLGSMLSKLHLFASSTIFRILQATWHLLPFATRIRLVRSMRSLLRLSRSTTQTKTLLFGIIRRGWHLLPLMIRIRLVRLFERN